MSAKSMEEIAAYMKKMRFRKKFIGGVDEADVWKQLEKLHAEYQSAFDAKKEQTWALIKEREAMISKLKKRLEIAEHNRGGFDV